MANIRLKKLILEVVNNQLRDNDPPAAKQAYDEKRYTEALNEMVQQNIDFENTHKIVTEWDRWGELVQHGYDAQENRNEAQMISSWWEAWNVFQEIMKSAEMKMSVSGVMESQDYQYPVDQPDNNLPSIFVKLSNNLT